MTIHDSSSINIKLDSTNYRVGSKILEMRIISREKKDYIIGRKVTPKKNDPTYNKYEAEDALVKS